VKVILGYSLLKVRVFFVMTTPEDGPCRTVVKQHEGKTRGDKSFQVLAIHT